MDISDVFSQTRETLTVKRVFGEPYEKNGITVIPVPRVRGGAGSGGGEGPMGWERVQVAEWRLRPARSASTSSRAIS